ncbi:putative cutinase transcription factor 1 alpha [Xylogone sp. PMI_703]|nr:putative cutinase transcription factor 1 alpha [Xylogone sp. PMI_703]
MSSLAARDGATRIKRRRAKQACRVCNARRVRCNVLERHPCDRCERSGVSCEIIPSRRGRRPTKKQSSDVLGQPQSPEFLGAKGSSPARAREYCSPATQSPIHNETSGSGHKSPIISVAEQNVPSTPAQALFFGESNLLTCVAGSGAEDTPAPSNKAQERLVYPISDAINIRASKLFAEHTLPTSSSKAHYLAKEGAFTLPDPQDCVSVLKAYFKWFHPAFPIVDRIEIANKYHKGEMSPLLLQAMLFIGASYCDDDTVHRMGFKDRPEAKSQLYNRAKILYDADWESSEMIILQSLFLISFWRAGPLNVKTTRYWLGAAISLAQARGFHRSPQLPGMNLQQKKLRKRIWWSIYVRDRQSSASLGLPSRIQDEDCDVETLNYSDFIEEGEVIIPEFLGNYREEHGIYAIQMARLAQLLGKILATQFRPNRDRPNKDEIRKLVVSLEEWKAMLPDNMRSCEMENETETIWTYLLHLGYNYLHILLHRQAYTQSGAKNIADGRPALQAACRVTRIVEDMLSENLVQFGQMHLITSLFSSLCIHTIELQRSDRIARRLAEQRAQVCLIGLKEIQKYWEVNNLVLELFFQYLDDSTAKKLQGSIAEDLPSTERVNHDKGLVRSLNTPTLTRSTAATALEEGFDAVDNDISQISQIQSNQGSVLFDMPRNILSHGGSVDEFSFFLDQYLLNNGNGSLSDAFDNVIQN